MTIFQNRADAGEQLALQIMPYKNREDVLVLGLPRGGVVVAFPIAKLLGVPLDVLLVRKLGVPWHAELAMGAIALGDVTVMNEDVLEFERITPEEQQEVIERERKELARRNQLYRAGREPLDFHGRTIILVDDGVATGATIHAAIKAIKKQGCAKLVVAVPVAPPSAVEELEQLADEVICLATPEHFYAISGYYNEFPQTSSEEVVTFLELANKTRPESK